MAERFLLLLITVCGLARLSHAGDQFIRIKPVTNINSNQEQVLLGDIADITAPSGVSEETTRAIAELVLFNKSEIDTKPLAGSQVMASLRKYSAQLTGFQVIVPKSIVLNFGDQIRAGVGSNSVAGASELDRAMVENVKTAHRIESELSKKLLSWGVIGNWSIEVKNLKIPFGSPITAENRINLSSMNVRPKGMTSIPVTVIDTAKSDSEKTIWVQADVHYSAKVPVLTRNIQAGQNITQSDVRLEKRDVTFVSDAFATFEELSAQPQAALSLNQGAMLLKSHLQRELAARRGEEVTITAGGSDFKVSAKGIAEGQGYVGDLIKVKNLQTQKALMGTLVSKGTVQVGY